MLNSSHFKTALISFATRYYVNFINTFQCIVNGEYCLPKCNLIFNAIVNPITFYAGLLIFNKRCVGLARLTLFFASKAFDVR